MIAMILNVCKPPGLLMHVIAEYSYLIKIINEVNEGMWVSIIIRAPSHLSSLGIVMVTGFVLPLLCLIAASVEGNYHINHLSNIIALRKVVINCIITCGEGL